MARKIPKSKKSVAKVAVQQKRKPMEKGTRKGISMKLNEKEVNDEMYDKKRGKW